MECKRDSLVLAFQSKDAAKFWVLVSDTYGLKNHFSNVIPARVWEFFFSEVYSNPLADENNGYTLATQLPEYPPVTHEAIIEAAFKFSPNKATGPDGIPLEAIIHKLDWWVPSLPMLFTHINNTGHIPTSWREGIIVPIYKTRVDPANYHPITLLSILGKIYSSLLLDKLQDCAAF